MSSPCSSIDTAWTLASNERNAMIAPTYVGPSTATSSPRSGNAFERSSSASMPPLVTSSSESPGRRSRRPRIALRVPSSPRVGAYWNSLASSSPTSSATRSAGNVRGSGKPPANEIRSGFPSKPRIAAIPSPAPARVRSANCQAWRTAMRLTIPPAPRDHPEATKFLKSTPGILTAVATFLAAVTGLIAALTQLRGNGDHAAAATTTVEAQSSADSELLADIPSSIRASCGKAVDPEPGNAAAFNCSYRDVVHLHYNLYASAT